ncbi:MAG: tetratricopeptide repeat protein, partial [Gammaproteobacteria bacterium]|nr:tetratricopeptide repeat protein [Gammaproteobacteria bacterium]
MRSSRASIARAGFVLLVVLSLAVTLAAQDDDTGESGCSAQTDYIEIGLDAAFKGDDAAALVAFNCAVTLAPDDAEARRLRAETAFALGNVESALDDYNALLEIDAEDTAALLGRARALVLQGESDAALADYNTLLELDPENVTV